MLFIWHPTSLEQVSPTDESKAFCILNQKQIMNYPLPAWEYGIEPDDDEYNPFHERCVCGAFLPQKAVDTGEHILQECTKCKRTIELR